jgi:DNA primase
MESVLPRMKDGRQAFFLFLPEGEDPDTLVRAEGAAGFDARLRDAVPLSQFFYDELAKDVNLATLDGRARLAERAKPLLAQIPDGAFGDLMRQRLTEITGVGARADASPPAAPVRSRTMPAQTQKRSLVRSAIALLLQRPALALELEPPYGFGALRHPGVPLLAELISLVRARPEITVGALLEHFEGREEAAALQKLASQALPGEEDKWREEFLDAMAQLERQTLQQRIEELQTKQRETGLDEHDKAEMRALLSQLHPAVR